MKEGSLRYVCTSTLPAEAFEDLFDLETRLLSCGPGDDPHDMEALLKSIGTPKPDSTRMAIMLGDDVIGKIDFAGTRGPPVIGFVVHRDHRGKGVLKRAWNDLAPGLGHRFRGYSWTHNAPAAAAMRSLGFVCTRAIQGHAHPILRWDYTSPEFRRLLDR
jgi:RimJ/RimL family protein N-acetyltransferase